jgi:hypothetical protein
LGTVSPTIAKIHDVTAPSISHASTTTTAQDAMGHTQLSCPAHNHAETDSTKQETISPAGKMIPGPVRVGRLQLHLQGYPLAGRIIDGFTNGFRLQFDGPQMPLSSKNSPSAAVNPQIIQEKLAKESALGRIAGPFSQPPLPNFKSSPLALREKSTPGTFRLLHNLSYPYDISSLNRNIPKTATTVKYQTLQDAINFIQASKQPAWFAKSDIADAFRIVPVHPDNYNLLGFSFQNHYYYDRMLSMGSAQSCNIFEQFSDAIQWILKHKYGIVNVVKVLDDFLFIEPTSERCQQDLHTFLQLCDDIGIPVAPHKTEGPTTTITFLGIELDSIAMQARLPISKLHAYTQDVVALANSSKTTLKNLKATIGKLQFATTVIPSGRAFLRRLHDLTIGIEKPYYYLRLTQQARLDLNMWATFLQDHNGITIIRPPSVVHSDQINMAADASKTGFGATYGSSWIQGLWPPLWSTFHITFLELFPVYATIHIFAHKLKNSIITFWSDNMGVVQILNKQTSKCHLIMQLVRPLVLLLLQFNIQLHSKHIPGKNNILCDAISRQRATKDLLQQYGMHAKPTPLPSSLQPQNFNINLIPS